MATSNLPRLKGPGGKGEPVVKVKPNAMQQDLSGSIPLDHPFDSPFTIMQSLQAQIVELREMMQVEQKKRIAAVDAVVQDVEVLRKAIHKEQSERVVENTVIKQSLEEKDMQRRNDCNLLKADVAYEMPLKATVVEVERLSKNVRLLADELATEKKLQIDDIKLLNIKIDQNAAGDNSFAQDVVRQLGDQKRMLDDNEKNDQNFANHIMPALHRAGQLMMLAGQVSASLSRAPLARPLPAEPAKIDGLGSVTLAMTKIGPNVKFAKK